jgi:hypothetical protein
MQTVSSFVLAAGLAAAVASPALADPPIPAGDRADPRTERAPIDLATPRDGVNFNGEFVTMRDELENFPLNTNLGGSGVSAAPASFTGPPGFLWPLNNLRGQADGATSGNIWARVVDLSTSPVGGPNGVINASKALRIQTAAAQAPGGFFTGANLRFGGQTGEPTLPLAPSADNAARISAEYYISTIDQLFTFEAASTFSGFTTGRIMWGGVCTEDDPGDCTDIGVPIGLNPHILSLGVTCTGFSTCEFGFARYCVDVQGNTIPGCVPPPGLAIGDLVSPPTGEWCRFACETTQDGRLRFFLDLYNGFGEVQIVDQGIFSTALIDRVSANTSFEAQDAFLLVDNIEASGHIFASRTPPPLECPYCDGIEWLSTGPILGQTSRWFVALSSAATVIDDGAQGQVISQINNVVPNNEYRREMSTELPLSSATLSNDLVATVQVRTTGSTVRGFALVDGSDLAARVLLNYWPPDSLDFDNGVYVQTNPAYEPIDGEGATDPLVNAPDIGADIVDTQHDWDNNGVYRTLEMRLSASGVLRVSIDGQRIYAGAGAFTNTIDTFVFESENNSSGSGATFRINDVTLVCDAPSCAADFDFDDIITFADLNAVLSNFGATGLSGFNAGDANGNGAIDFADLNAVLSAFGTTCD